MNTKKMTGDYVRVAIWNGAYRRICSVKTVLGLINNMFVGVTEVSMLTALLRPLFIVRIGYRLRLKSSKMEIVCFFFCVF